MVNIYKKLASIQAELIAPKDRPNDFGGFNYRSAEDVLELVKPLCFKNATTLVLYDEIVNINDRFYIKAVAELHDWESDSIVGACAFAREPQSKAKMDDAQVTGSSSSYARKYALNGLFNIDDRKQDPDSNEYHEQTTGEKPKLCTEKQASMIESMVKTDEQKAWMKKHFKTDVPSELTMKQASDLIKIIKSKESKQ